jgi:hypothetical protein
MSQYFLAHSPFGCLPIDSSERIQVRAPKLARRYLDFRLVWLIGRWVVGLAAQFIPKRRSEISTAHVQYWR